MISKKVQLERRIVVQSALASQRIEGLEPDAKVIEDAQKWARGEMSIADAITDYKARLRQEQTDRAALFVELQEARDVRRTAAFAFKKSADVARPASAWQYSTMNMLATALARGEICFAMLYGLQ